MLARRKQLSPSEVEAKSSAILANLQSIFESQTYQKVHLFLSIQKFGEVATGPIIEHLRTYYPNTDIGVPRVDSGTNTLVHHRFSESELRKSSWGIREPVASSPILAAETFDLVLVPMLAFDKRGYRVGYGGGYYDKFLAQVRPECRKVGLCFEFGRLDEDIPNNQFDIKLDCVVTELGVVPLVRSSRNWNA